MSVYWGCDPSTQRVSIAWARHDSGVQGVLTRSFRTDLRDGQRLWHIYAETFTLCQEVLHDSGHPTLTLVEQPFANPRGGNRVNPVSYMALGVSMAAIYRITKMPVDLCKSPGWWKRRSVGFGNASKDQVMAWAKYHGYAGSLQDEADAMGVAEAARAWAA